MSKITFTQGPWYWVVDKAYKAVQLRNKSNDYVMDVVRYGISGASPRFVQNGLLCRADELARVVPGREHHSNWFQSIDHPDAHLIATAPDLYVLLQEALPYIEGCDDLVRRCEAALAKARGEKL